METSGMKEAKCSLLLAVDGSFQPRIKSLPQQRLLVHQDLKVYNQETTTETSGFYVNFPGCTIMQLEPSAGKTQGSSPAPVPKMMPVTLTVAGRCYFTHENYRDFKTLMRTKEQSQQLGIPPNGCFDWPDVESMLLCPLCGTVAATPQQGAHEDTAEEFWMLFYPLIQITVIKGTRMTLGTRTICRLTCVECLQDLLDGMTLTVKQAGGPERQRPSMLSFSLSALEILEEAGSASFLQDSPPRPVSHAHVDDEMDAWTLYNLWEHSGAWEALQHDYRIVLARSMQATIDQPSQQQNRDTAQEAFATTGTKERYGRKCGNMACKKAHGKKSGSGGEQMDRLSIPCEVCESVCYCSKACRKAAASDHKELCLKRQKEQREPKTQKVKRVQCDTCKKVSPYTHMKKCSRCKNATYCGFECQKKDWGRHKLCCDQNDDGK